MDVETIPGQQKWNFRHQNLSRRSRAGPPTNTAEDVPPQPPPHQLSPCAVDQDMGTCSCRIGRMQETERAVPCSRFAGWIRRCLHLHHSWPGVVVLLNKIQMSLGHADQTQQPRCTCAQNSPPKIMITYGQQYYRQALSMAVGKITRSR